MVGDEITRLSLSPDRFTQTRGQFTTEKPSTQPLGTCRSYESTVVDEVDVRVSSSCPVPSDVYPVDYYERLPCKPGVGFWESIFRFRPEFSEVKASVEKLFDIPIPPTFVIRGYQSFGLIPGSAGVLGAVEDLSAEMIVDACTLGTSGSQPIAVRKRIKRLSGSTRSLTHAIPPVSLLGVVRKLPELEELVVVQGYCQLPKASVKPHVLRIFHSPAGGKPFGYVITNTVTPGAAAGRSDSGVSEEELTAMYCASTDTTPEGKLAIFRVSGKAISAAVEIAQRAFRFIEHYFTLRLSEVVVDVIPIGCSSGNRAYQLVQIKSFRLKAFVSPSRQLALTGRKHQSFEPSDLTTAANANAVFVVPKLRSCEDAVRKMLCFFCRQRRRDLPKTVTLKMVSQCRRRLQARGVTEPAFAKNTHQGGGSGGINIFHCCCEVCYSIIVNEQQLFRVSQRFRKLQLSGGKFSHPVSSSAAASTHWRLLLVVNGISDFPAHLLGENQVFQVELVTSVGTLVCSSTGGFRVIDFFAPHPELGDVEVNLVSSGRVVGKGSISILDRLLSVARFADIPSVTQLNCYLGVDQWTVSVSLGVQRLHVVDAESESAVSSTKIYVPPEGFLNNKMLPLPDRWMESVLHVTGQRRRTGRRRSSCGRPSC